MRGARLAAAALAGLIAAAALTATATAARAGTSGLAGSSVTTRPAAVAVLAHAAIASTQPADGTVVSKAPQQVSASFDETVGVSSDSLVVYSPSGERVADGTTFHVTSYEIAVRLLPGLGDGTYTGVWHVISADTHPVQGAFTFSIGAPSATHVGALLPGTSAVVGDLFTVVRWLEYLCFALLGGGVAFLIICWPEGGGRKDVGRLVTVSALGLLLSTLAGLLLEGPYGAGTGLSQVFSASLVRQTMRGSLGPASEVREALSLLAAGTGAFLLPRLPVATAGFRRVAGAAWAVLITGIAGSWAVYDHASVGVQSPWGIPADIVHLDAMTLWIGGLAMLAGVALRQREIRSGPGDGPGRSTAVALARAVPRFSAIAFGSVIALVASGLYQTWREVGTGGALAGTTYGRLVLAKAAGLLALIALGYLARRYIQRGLPSAAALARMGRMPLATGAVRVTGPLVIAGYGATVAADAAVVPAGHGGPGGPGRPPPPRQPPGGSRVWALAMRRLRRSVAAELGVAVVILALTALLVNTANGREAYAPTLSASRAFDTGGPGGAGIVHVFAGPARLGANTIEVYLTTAGGQAFRPAEVTAALYFSARGLGPLPVVLTRTAPGQYRAKDATVSFTGQWTLQVIVRSDAFDETSVTFPLGIH